MKRRRLTQGQRDALRRLADQIQLEDPELADRFATALRGSGRRAVPRWERLCLVGGVLLLVAGVYLGVGSSALLGLGLIAVALLRNRQRRARADAGTGGSQPRTRAGE